MFSVFCVIYFANRYFPHSLLSCLHSLFSCFHYAVFVALNDWLGGWFKPLGDDATVSERRIAQSSIEFDAQRLMRRIRLFQLHDWIFQIVFVVYFAVHWLTFFFSMLFVKLTNNMIVYLIFSLLKYILLRLRGWKCILNPSNFLIQLAGSFGFYFNIFVFE